jgi:hypothetical protein
MVAISSSSDEEMFPRTVARPGLSNAGMEIWAGMVLLGLVGFVLGFALNRGSICTVGAAIQATASSAAAPGVTRASRSARPSASGAISTSGSTLSASA